MTTRRSFLKCSALFAAAASFPVPFALTQTKSASAAELPDPLFTSPHPEIVLRAPKPRVITIPDVGNYKVLKGDFHLHTLFSDGLVMPKVRVQEAIQNGLDCISITDHIEYRPNLGGKSIQLQENNDDHNIAYNIALPEAEKNELLLVRGTEITKSEWHFNGLFLQDVNKIAAVVDDWRAMLAVAVEQGGFIQWNHPSWIDRTPNVAPDGLKKGEPMRFFDELEEVRKKGLLHGIEVFNGRSHYPIVSDWCNERNLGVIAVSDIHPPESQQYGIQNLRRPMTLILAEDRTEKSIREAFFAHRTIGWAADMIFGRPEWVEKLLRACIEVKADGASEKCSVQNKGDIPVRIQVRNTDYELQPQQRISIACSASDTLRFTNWFVGTNKPLELAVSELVK